MSTGHSEYQSVLVYRYYIPRGRKLLCFWGLITLFVITFLPSANNSVHLLLKYVDFSDRVIFSVAHINEVLVVSVQMAKSLRMMKLSVVERAINKPNLAIASNP